MGLAPISTVKYGFKTSVPNTLNPSTSRTIIIPD
jgi:hypothetical protein